ncbi:rRNA maturation RNase YbeY [Zwartia sp.]|uniref:rRNA maturation RNase YbeY n=1 Tax=Zwartia sp. TaxID=2978004 RepID=UPI002725CE31|nr:rRNA maturation RNase YbeY [Zwartia sp.]MDO9024823.1 rRNA maturation RNase YbeY [Zwartia sp.]
MSKQNKTATKVSVAKPSAKTSTTSATARSKNTTLAPTLSLSIQYALEVPLLPRWRVRRWVQRAIDAAQQDGLVDFTRMQVGVRFVGLAEARQLNAGYRQKDYATNVLTFEYGVQPDGTASGDIVLCVPVLKREAKEQRKDFLCHAAHLVIHGTLHALSYDHIKQRDAKHMESLETSILAELGIDNPYLVTETKRKVLL